MAISQTCLRCGYNVDNSQNSLDLNRAVGRIATMSSSGLSLAERLNVSVPGGRTARVRAGAARRPSPYVCQVPEGPSMSYRCLFTRLVLPYT